MSSGCVAGTVSRNGYVRIVLNGRPYRAHRLAWLVSYGEWPLLQIDHVNGIRHDNRLINLRMCSHSENCQNTKIRADNISNIKGVTWHNRENKWRVSIGVSGRRIVLGMFKEIEFAELVASEARDKYHGTFARHL
ncbi:HNH endonuclease [Pectobacterium odoriferum]|uniref:HNH endonuclease n=1 Tax=Pectobacterium odoriferum TaxID=78398 RepID=UPI003CC724B7